MTRDSGFTLIELMIVVAIIGVISAIAIPLYQDYVVRTQINRAVGELAPYKTAFEERASSGGNVTNGPIGYTVSDLTTGDQATDIATLNPDGSGQLQVTMGGKAHPIVSGLIVRFERSPSGEWECVIDNSALGSVWKASYLPSACRL